MEHGKQLAAALLALLLVLAAGEIFAGVFFLVNPAMLRPGVDSETVGTMWALAAAGSTAATLLAWAVLRGLGRLERTTGRTMEGLLLGAAVLLGWLAAWSQCADLIAELRAAAESNTAPGLILWPTYLVLCLLAAADLIPELLGCAVLVWGGRLARAMESAPANVRFPGFVDRERLREAYCGADVFAFMSREETEGIVVLEALACGIPTVVRDIPVYGGWLESGKNVYKASNTDEFQQSVEGMLAGSLPDLTSAGRATAESRSLEAVGSQLRDIYCRERILPPLPSPVRQRHVRA